MTKFEQIGINIQLESASKADALKRFSYSCNLCCHKGIRINCDRCAIAHTHRQLIAIFEDKEESANENHNQQ